VALACPIGYSDPTCSTRTCENPTLGTCSGNGKCSPVDNQMCVCTQLFNGGGYTGLTCEIYIATTWHVPLLGASPVCTGGAYDPVHQPGGRFVIPVTAGCNAPYGYCNGSVCLCSIWRDGANCELSRTCFNDGVFTLGPDGQTGACQCRNGYRGDDCQIFPTNFDASCWDDTLQIMCNNQGLCYTSNNLLDVAEGICISCNPGFVGYQCQTSTCLGSNGVTCNDNGSCDTNTLTCVCNPNWTGGLCETFV